MTPEQRVRIEQLLDILLDIPPQDRRAQLDKLCADDCEVRDEVIRLLSATADDSVSKGPGMVQMFKAACDIANAVTDDLAPGTKLGQYRILENLGEGGFGSVYKAAERGDIKRLVALKVIKPGVDTKQVLARFESERQALAYMNHPGIAKLFNAGKTENGRPFFAMEYVPGARITDFADQNRLSVADRLKLFQQVCLAISHAHQKAIIHRDIKASNILASCADGQATAKVIDFGIAKALTGDRLTDRTFQETGRGTAIGTYESMSPEQADGQPDIDTRTDVYSLGVLLYELLAGVKPLSEMIGESSTDDAIRQIIRNIDPPRPSVRISLMRESANTIAQARQTSVRDLTKTLTSELEWIPMMAMRKERDRRYASAVDLSDDVTNYLERRPLRAGPESLAYRARKFVARNRTATFTSSAILLCLAIFLAAYVQTIRTMNRRVLLEQKNTIDALNAKETALTQVSQLLQESAARNERLVSVNNILGPLMSAETFIQKPMPPTHLDQTPFSEAISYLRDVTGFSIRVHWQMLQAAGIDPATPLSGVVGDDPEKIPRGWGIGEILHMVRPDGSVRWMIDDQGAMVITTSWMAAQMSVWRPIYINLDNPSEMNRLTSSAKQTFGDYFRNAISAPGVLWLYGPLGLHEQLNASEKYLYGIDDPELPTSEKDKRPWMVAPNHPPAASLRPDPTILLQCGQQALYAIDGRDKHQQEEEFREAIDILRWALPSDRTELCQALVSFAKFLLAQGRFDAAEPFLREALDKQKQLLGEQAVATMQTAEMLKHLEVARANFHKELVRQTQDIVSRFSTAIRACNSAIDTDDFSTAQRRLEDARIAREIDPRIFPPPILSDIDLVISQTEQRLADEKVAYQKRTARP